MGLLFAQCVAGAVATGELTSFVPMLYPCLCGGWQGVDSYLYICSEKPLHSGCNWTNQIACSDHLGGHLSGHMKSDQSDSYIWHLKPEFIFCLNFNSKQAAVLPRLFLTMFVGGGHSENAKGMSPCISLLSPPSGPSVCRCR